MLTVGNEFPYRPGDAVQINDKYPNLDIYKGKTFYVGATGWVASVPVVWLHGEGSPISCVALDGVDPVKSLDGVESERN